MVCSIGRPYSQVIDYAEENYSTSSQAIANSRWFGHGATMLGLEGQVTPLDYTNIYQGKDNDNNSLRRQLSERNSNPGRDLTFSAPKSVSLLVLIGNEIKVIEAHDRAVNKALAYIEENCIFTRTGKGGVNHQQTNNAIVAVFAHNDNRNHDPHLHNHCVVFNLTRGQDQKWRSMDNRQLYQQKMTVGAIYHHELGHQLQTLGYKLDWRKDGTFELSGYKPEHLKIFSSRRTEIINAVGENSNAVEKAIACTSTRIGKEYKTVFQSAALRQQWKDKAKQINLVHPSPSLDYKKQIELDRKKATYQSQKLTDLALQKLSNDKIVFYQHQFLREVLIKSKGQYQLEQLKRNIEEHKSLVKTSDGKLTTLSLLETQKVNTQTLLDSQNVKTQNKSNQKFNETDKLIRTQKILDDLPKIDTVVRDFLTADNKTQIQTLILTENEEDKKKLINQIRNGLIKEKQLGKDVHQIDILKSRSIDKQSVKNIDVYRVGEIVKFDRDSALFDRHLFYRIDAIDRERKTMTIRDRFDQSTELPVNRYKGRQVYQPQKLKIRSGEQMQFTRSYYHQGKKIFVNQKFRINGIKNHKVSIEMKGKHLEVNLEQLLHSDYGYVNTIKQQLGKFPSRCIYISNTKEIKNMDKPEKQIQSLVSRSSSKVTTNDKSSKEVSPKFTSKLKQSSSSNKEVRQEPESYNIPRSEEFKLIVAAKYLVEQLGAKLRKTEASQNTLSSVKVYQAKDGTQIKREPGGLTITHQGKEVQFDRHNSRIFNTFSPQQIQSQIKARTNELQQLQSQSFSLGKTKDLSIER